jgi:GntR family transcriptional regulator
MDYVIDPSSSLPLYYQIQQNITALIESEVLKVSDPLPSERELSERYQVTRMTVRQAVNQLVSDGVLERRRGIGTFVALGRKHPSLSPSVAGFSERFREAGMRPTSRVLNFETIPASTTVAQRLSIEAGEIVVFLRRLRLVDGVPLMVETSHLPYAALEGIMEVDFSQASLYAILAERFAMPVVQAEHTLEPVLLHQDEARLLGLKEGQPAMLVHIVAHTAEGLAIEFSKAVIRGDRCRYYFTATIEVKAHSGA